MGLKTTERTNLIKTFDKELLLSLSTFTNMTSVGLLVDKFTIVVGSWDPFNAAGLRPREWDLPEVGKETEKLPEEEFLEFYGVKKIS
jgi:hypothetical protein